MRRREGEIMPFRRFVLTKNTRKRHKLHGLQCSDCGYEFEDGDVVYKRWGKYVKEHLCEECYNGKFIDV